MSKKKNTLKELDEFLKQQAATLVEPDPLRDQNKVTTTAGTIAEESTGDAPLTSDKLLRDLKVFAEQEGPSFRKKFYDLIIKSLEVQTPSLPEDKMLINTALYLKGGDNWKDEIREYWQKRR